MHTLFTVCTEQVRSPYTELAASRLHNPTHLEGEVRFDQAQDQQVVTTRSPRIVRGGLCPTIVYHGNKLAFTLLLTSMSLDVVDLFSFCQHKTKR